MIVETLRTIVVSAVTMGLVVLGGGAGGSTPTTLSDIVVGSFVESPSCVATPGLQEMNGTTLVGGVSAYPTLATKWPTWVVGGDIVVPDWRGMFMRNSGGSAAAVGVVQADATAANGLSVDDVQIQSFRVGIAGGPNAAWFADGGTGTDQSYTVSGDTETRPINVALQKCVILEL